jgi:hypothetical protein
MPNGIKYSTDAQSLALKKGNFYIGIGDVGKGPTSTTGYYKGISPPIGGYTIYLNKDTNGPAIYTVLNDTQLIDLTNKIAGTSYTTVNECFNYYTGQSDKIVINMDYESIVTNGLVMNLDAGFTSSYPRNGTTWYDIAISNNGTLVNGPTFNSTNGGSIVFDGSNDYVVLINNTNLDSQSITMESWCYVSSVFQNGFLFEKGSVNTQYSNFFNNDGNFYFRTVGLNNWDLTFYAPNYITTNTWNHIVCTYSSGIKSIYVNGTQVAGQTGLSGTISTNPTGLYIGAYGPGTGYFLNGRIAASRVYNRALSQSEIINNFRFGGQKAFTGCKTCKDIIDNYPQLAGYDGLYWVYPGGPTSSPYQVYCDMTTDGGGWMLVARSSPSVNLNGENWGWKGGKVGSINDFSQAYQLQWYDVWDGNATFTSFIFGNQRTNADNSWGPFIYKVSSINYATFFGSDTQQYYSLSTLKSDTSVYGTTSYPGMQQAVGYTTTGTNNNIYYLRDCCGFAGIGGGWGGMSTYYCGAAFYYSGPWCGGETTTGGIYDFNTYVSNGLTYGGTQHYMIMVK